jgi:hypothetical protein
VEILVDGSARHEGRVQQRQVHALQLGGRHDRAATDSGMPSPTIRQSRSWYSGGLPYGTDARRGGMAVQNGGLWVQSPELELRDLPGDTPNRLRKARAKELSES